MQMNEENHFWKNIWKRNHIPFHLTQVHPLLKKYFPLFKAAWNQSILLPLSGKTLDILYLKRQKLKVIGVEISKKAVEDFKRENKLKMKRKGSHYYTHHLNIWQDDFFHLDKKNIDSDYLYDRAGLIALNPKQRKQYFEKINSLQIKRGLIISIEYPQEKYPGPPYSVSEEEITKGLKNYKVRKIEESFMGPAGFSSEPFDLWQKVYFIYN